MPNYYAIQSKKSGHWVSGYPFAETYTDNSARARAYTCRADAKREACEYSDRVVKHPIYS